MQYLQLLNINDACAYHSEKGCGGIEMGYFDPLITPFIITYEQVQMFFTY